MDNKISKRNKKWLAEITSNVNELYRYKEDIYRTINNLINRIKENDYGRNGHSIKHAA